MAEKTDEELVKEVQRGDIQSFGILVDRYEEKIKRYAKRFLFDREDANDITQDVFMKAYVNIRSFDSSRRFSPWIYRIAHNQFVNELKKKRRERIVTFDLDVLFPHPKAKEAADTEANRQDLRRLLDTHLEKLPPKYREPLTLYYFEEMEYREIAEILRVPVATVGIRLRRGKLLMKKLMERSGVTYA